MNARRVVSLFVMTVVAAQAALALAQTGGAAAPAQAQAARTPASATVGTTRIATADLDRRTAQAVSEFSRRSGNAELPAEMRDLVRRQVLESLIRQELLALEARRTGVTASVAEAEAILKQESFFNPAGKFDEQRWMAIKTTQKATYESAIAAIRQQLAGRKLGEQLAQRFMPSEAKARAQAQRALARVTAEVMGLRRSDFDGSYPEPREQEVLDWYRTHQGDYERVARATLTVAFVNSPGLGDEERDKPGAREAWSRRMKAVADSLLAEVAKGNDFERVVAYLSPRPGIVVAADNFPGYWRGSDAQNRRLFDVKLRGNVFPEPIAGEEGWMVVKVNEVSPAHVAPLRDVAREIRGLLRRDRKLHAEEYALRDLHATLADSLAAPGWRVRWAVFDTASIRVPEPTAADLDRYYRGHLADYSAFDAASGGVVAKPLAEVKDDVRSGFLRDARVREARLAADRVQRAWQSGKREAAAEALATVREAAAPMGADFDATREGAVVADSVWAHDPPRGGLIVTRRGWIVWHPVARVERAVPDFGQARGALAAARKGRIEAEELAGARRMFDENPRQFSRGNVVSFTRVIVAPPALLQIPLTRAEVEQFHRENLDKYSAPELLRARHILIEPTAQTADADGQARQLATRLLDRARSGEDFAALAREYSMDIATKDKGGDLGVFTRGTMLDAFERAAFAMQAGDFVPDPVRTDVGWHVIQVTEHEPAVVQPLPWIYASVSSDAALAKGERMARATADSIMRLSRRPADVLRMAAQKGFTVVPNEHKIGDNVPSSNTRSFFEEIERLRPGQMIAEPFRMKGQGCWIAWVDSISPPRTPSWDEARTLAVDAYRRLGGERAMNAKRAELDSMLARGWAVDSVAALWGGPERTKELPPGKGLSGMGGTAEFDSLAFGTERTKPQALGEWTPGWVTLPNGVVRVRITERTEPAAGQLADRVASIRAAESELGLRDYFEEAKKRWPVRILEPRMREMQLAAPPLDGGGR